MRTEDNEEKELGLVGLQNAHSILQARRRAEDELRRQSEWLRIMLSSIGDAVISTDADGRISFMNGVAESLTAWSQAEALGRPLPEVFCIVNEQSREPVENPAIRALTEGTIVGLANPSILVAKDGTERPIDDRAAPIRSNTGEGIGCILVFRDITERKQAEESRARLAAIVDSSGDAIISKTLDGIITSWNSGAEQLLGYQAEEMVGQPITRIIPPEHRGEAVKILERLRREERVDHFETVRVAKDGRRIEVSISISPIRDITGRVVGAAKIARDITDRKQTEEALRLAQVELAERASHLEEAVAERTAELTATNEQLESFVYSIAHDLRAPLRSMMGFSHLLIDEHAAGLNETGQNFLKRINASSEFMDQLLLDLLAYGRTTRSEMELGPVDVVKAWQTALFQTATQAEQTRARIEFIGPKATARAHEATLGQCLANLLSNAMKFVAHGRQPHVRFRTEEIAPTTSGAEAKVRLWVEDNGIGIPTQHHERVFRVFERLNGAGYPGTGIGLSIVRKGAERMGGHVGLESELGKGTRFWIELAKAN